MRHPGRVGAFVPDFGNFLTGLRVRHYNDVKVSTQMNITRRANYELDVQII
jgi:hypothetical protein